MRLYHQLASSMLLMLSDKPILKSLVCALNATFSLRANQLYSHHGFKASQTHELTLFLKLP